jgi:hypothetical protein
MEEDRKFWIRLWVLGTVAFFVLIVSLTLSDAWKKHVIYKAIEIGVDPQDAWCAFNTPVGEFLILCVE